VGCAASAGPTTGWWLAGLAGLALMGLRRREEEV
jgi:MYXO-CTERM domain-containing protein